jgi:hypothetical protein
VPCFAGDLISAAVPATVDPLFVEEVLYGVKNGNNQAAICSGFIFSEEPSDGLEPSTPPLPSSDDARSAGTRGPPRARKPRKKKESPENE